MHSRMRRSHAAFDKLGVIQSAWLESVLSHSLAKTQSLGASLRVFVLSLHTWLPQGVVHVFELCLAVEVHAPPLYSHQIVKHRVQSAVWEQRDVLMQHAALMLCVVPRRSVEAQNLVGRASDLAQEHPPM